MTIINQWNTYVKMVYGSSEAVPEDQFKETRRAFYAGCAGMFALINTASENEDAIALEHIQELSNEIRLFAAEVQAGLK
jgi:hypothetical protein